MRRILLPLMLSLALAGGNAAAQSYSTVEERMTGAEFKAAGLDKLSPEELAALNAWLQKQNSRAVAQGGVAAVPYVDRNGFDDATERREIISRIKGDFTGWRGGTVFTLENGQVWRQVDASELAGIGTLSSPGVRIRPGVISGWRMQVEGYNSAVKVERVK